MSAGTGIGTPGNAIETQSALLEAETNTGGINISNFGSIQIGSLSDEVNGLHVLTSRNITFTTFGSIFLGDVDLDPGNPPAAPLASVTGGSVSGNVTLTANGFNSDIIGGVGTLNGVVSAISTLTANVNQDTLTGNAGVNVLNGTGGADTMRGIGGNDVYVVDNAGDFVDESIAGSSGTDTVQSSISFSLAGTLGDVERLILSGSANINGTGNALANILEGNSGVNQLDGGAGIDTLRGRRGNDNYIVDNAGDIVDEAYLGGTGTDTVYSTVPFNLTNSATVLGTVERLLLQGGANVLNGLAGGDTLTGGTGNDTFRFNSALGSTNINTITD